ncbi:MULTISPECIES: ribosomal protein L13e [Acidianus]|uniref:50S ribosomal protein L13e n=1 Tax=Candidatus Acidianus copahuensis TaxID=1160895 RepID=A0A031LP04_9CREN|nr:MULTISPECIES: ribosomal protein L13e [Acidianus]EZQ06741.1 hypothetical protein CM19_04905 [Candidatus Acidianus copahuensis]NON61284.1 ribosomal protein L13e [Acidianus sp. RZ1]
MSSQTIKPLVKRPRYKFIPLNKQRKIKLGRGFSLGELKKAGITLSSAKEMKIRVDRRRKTINPENVELLKKVKSK